MIASIIRFVLSNYTLTCFVIGLAAAGIALARKPKPLSHEQIFDRLLAYYCLIGIGVYFCWNFVMHVFFGETAAKFIGWVDSPFQFEVGTASLGFGVVGLLAFRSDLGLRLAAINGPAMFMWGAAVGHVQQMIVRATSRRGTPASRSGWISCCRSWDMSCWPVGRGPGTTNRKCRTHQSRRFRLVHIVRSVRPVR